MRYLERINPLPQRVGQTLEKYQKDLDARASDKTPAHERTEIITKFWKARRGSKALNAIEAALKAMASGLERCMYCDEGHGHQIEHFRPKAIYNQETFTWENLLWVCGECNSQKNANFDERLLNPTSDDPLEELQLTSEGRFNAQPNSRGSLTLERIPRLRAQQLIDGRKLAFDHIKLVLTTWFPTADTEAKAKVREYVIKSPFGSVFASMLHVSRQANAIEVLGETFIEVLTQHPEMYSWLETADRERRVRAIDEIEAIASRIRVGATAEEEDEP